MYDTTGASTNQGRIGRYKEYSQNVFDKNITIQR